MAYKERRRLHILRALKAYALRCDGWTYPAIAHIIARRDHLTWRSLEFRDRPLSAARAREIAQHGARIVRNFNITRRRPIPKYLTGPNRTRIISVRS